MCTETFLRLPEEKKQRILNAAWKEFTSVSFAEVSINQIIRRADISRGSFYQYFTDKADLFSYLLHDACRRFRTVLKRLLPQVEGDFFRLHMLAYDYFTNRDQEATPVLRDCIEIIRANPGIDWEKMMNGELESNFLDNVLAQTDTTQLRRNDREFLRRLYAMSTMMLGSMVVDTLLHPERTEENRQELESMLDIIKIGSLACRSE